jgi:hypothetical protein
LENKIIHPIIIKDLIFKTLTGYKSGFFMKKGKIFISYRQSYTQSEASRLDDVFGEENVFLI